MAIEVLHHTSRVLAGNLPGDPVEREVWVYLPPGYQAGEKHYPVIYGLASFAATGAQLVTGNRWSPGIAARLDRLIGQGCPPVIAVFPDCFTRWGGSQYKNSPALGAYQDYLCDEIVPLVDEHFRTLPEREARAVFGRSSGGYGALRLAMHRPDVFGAFACHSGDMGFAWCYPPDFPHCAAVLWRIGSLEAWVKQFESREKKRGEDFQVVNVLAMAAAYSPDLERPFGIALPFDIETGELIEPLWQSWRDNDPVNMVKEHGDALRSMRLAFCDCGTRDEYHLHLGLALLEQRFAELAIPHVIERFDDTHRSLDYRHEIVLPQLAGALTPAR